MTRAEAERVEPDQRRAEEFLTQAGRFFADAERETTALESAVVLFWSACLSAMDAVLAREGWRIGRGDESRRLRIETPPPLWAPVIANSSIGWTSGGARDTRFRTPRLRPRPQWSTPCEQTRA